MKDDKLNQDDGVSKVAEHTEQNVLKICFIYSMLQYISHINFQKKVKNCLSW